MKQLHSLLGRQLKRHRISIENLSPELMNFINSIDSAYRQFDDDRGMLERSLELSSLELLQANSELRALFSAMPDLVFRIDIQGNILDIKGSSEGDFLLQPKKLLGKSIFAIPDEQLAEKFTSALKYVQKTKEGVVLEYTMMLHGQEQYFEARMMPLLEDQTIAIIRNITSRKEAEAELAQSRYMLQLVLDNIPQRVFWKDRESNYLGCNVPFGFDACLTDPKDIVGKTDYQLFGKASAEAYRADDKMVMESDTPKYGYEERQIRLDQTELWLRTSKIPLHDRQGQVIGILGTYEDITEIKQAEIIIKNSEERYRIASIATGQMIYDYNIANGSIQLAGAITAITGYAPKELQGKNINDWEQMIHPEDRAITLDLLRQAMEQKTEYAVAYRFLKRDGSYGHIEDTGAFLTDEFGNPYRRLGAMKDITEKILAEQEKMKVEEQLRQMSKMEAIGRLAGGVAHDFNNILTGIIGYTEMMISSLTPGDSFRNDLEEIHKASNRAASLTAQLLAFSRKQIIDPKVIDLNVHVSHSSKMLQRIIGEDIEFFFSPGHQLGYIKADQGQIEQVLVNMAANARDAMPDGGKLVIETANVEIDESYCRDHNEAIPGSYVMLSISDNGCGMEASTLEHLFEPFFTTKAKGKGTGLGLSMIYGIVRQNQGFINVYSEIDIGTTFKIYLPRVHETPEEKDHSLKAVLPSGSEKILLVEDEEMVRNLTQKVLEKQGYQVITAKNGAEALAEFEKLSGKIDLLITDVIMPNMNGKELYTRLHSTKPELRALFMSGYTENAIAHHGVLDKGTNFIQKPFSLESLTKKVRNILDH